MKTLQEYSEDQLTKSPAYKLPGEPVIAGWSKVDYDGEISNVQVASIAGNLARWTGAWLPRLNDRVRVTFNGFGTGTVMGFFCEAGWMGVYVECDKRPDWHIKRNGKAHPWPMCFGAEVERL